MKGLELYSKENFEHMIHVAKSIWESGRVQKEWIKNPQTVLLIMQRGYDLGMSPLAALDHLTQFRNEGAWGISISGAKGLVAAQGGTIAVTTDTDAEVAVKVTRKGWADHQEVVKLDECEKSGVMMSSKGKKDVWVKFPRAMLRATAIRRALTHMWSDVLVGCSPFDPEFETEEPAEGTTIETTPEDNKPRRSRRTKAEMEADALATTPPLASEPVKDPPVDPTTGNQGIAIATPVEPVVPPKVVEAPPAEDNPFANPLREEIREEAPKFDLGNMPHRMLLIEAIKASGLNPDQIKICRDAWKDNVWPNAHGVVATIESIIKGLKECCGASVSK